MHLNLIKLCHFIVRLWIYDFLKRLRVIVQMCSSYPSCPRHVIWIKTKWEGVKSSPLKRKAYQCNDRGNAGPSVWNWWSRLSLSLLSASVGNSKYACKSANCFSEWMGINLHLPFIVSKIWSETAKEYIPFVWTYHIPLLIDWTAQWINYDCC